MAIAEFAARLAGSADDWALEQAHLFGLAGHGISADNADNVRQRKAACTLMTSSSITTRIIPRGLVRRAGILGMVLMKYCRLPDNTRIYRFRAACMGC
ncbi:MAG: hypothetical protein D8B42_02135, partial [Kingella sp. (in: b-proteobacteria)]